MSAFNLSHKRTIALHYADFTYLGSNNSNEDSTSKDIKSRINKARNAYVKLKFGNIANITVKQ